MYKSDLKMMARAIALNCVRNTIIETYHSKGKLSDPEMKAFNKQVVNRIYTFLDCMLNRSDKERNLFMGRMVTISEGSTLKWDEPEIDENLWAGKKSMEKLIQQMQQIQDAQQEGIQSRQISGG